jgi:mannose-6-phosphate isomerase
MHAIGAGLLIAEIQQASDTTFRVYDWGRVDQDGRPRPLHLKQAIDATDFGLGPVQPEQPTQSGPSNIQTLIDCEKFVMNRVKLINPMEITGDGRFRILAITSGALNVVGEPSQQALNLGDTVLLPASLAKTELIPQAEGTEFLEIYVPDQDSPMKF